MKQFLIIIVCMATMQAMQSRITHYAEETGSKLNKIHNFRRRIFIGDCRPARDHNCIATTRYQIFDDSDYFEGNIRALTFTNNFCKELGQLLIIYTIQNMEKWGKCIKQSHEVTFDILVIDAMNTMNTQTVNLFEELGFNKNNSVWLRLKYTKETMQRLSHLEHEIENKYE